MNRQLDKLITAAILSVMSLIIGLVTYMLLEGMTLVDAFYMTIITISTVGFTEVKELSVGGRIFTSFYILLNLGLFAYIVSVFSSYFFEGKLRDIFQNYRSGMEISKLKDHVIVCGYGRNGKKACDELEKSGKPFVIIELEPTIKDSIPEHMKWILADATCDDSLKMVGIEKATDIIITTPSDAANVFITLTARDLNENINIISRATQPETENKLYRAGANKVILPDMLGGMFMAQLVTKPIVIEFLDLLNGVSGMKYHLEDVGYDQLKENYRDKTLKELDIKGKSGATVVGVKDDEKGIIPSPDEDTFIGKDDHLILLGSLEVLDGFMKEYTMKG